LEDVLQDAVGTLGRDRIGAAIRGPAFLVCRGSGDLSGLVANEVVDLVALGLDPTLIEFDLGSGIVSVSLVLPSVVAALSAEVVVLPIELLAVLEPGLDFFDAGEFGIGGAVWRVRASVSGFSYLVLPFPPN
jgi:hypothetical protein